VNRHRLELLRPIRSSCPDRRDEYISLQKENQENFNKNITKELKIRSALYLSSASREMSPLRLFPRTQSFFTPNVRSGEHRIFLENFRVYQALWCMSEERGAFEERAAALRARITFHKRELARLHNEYYAEIQAVNARTHPQKISRGLRSLTALVRTDLGKSVIHTRIDQLFP
jgi:hypothetical protein